MNKNTFVFLLVLFFYNANAELNICQFSQTVCSTNDKYNFSYVGNYCNCCRTAPSGAALVDKYHNYAFCYLGYWSYSYSYTIPANDAAYFYETWVGGCSGCVFV